MVATVKPKAGFKLSEALNVLWFEKNFGIFLGSDNYSSGGERALFGLMKVHKNKGACGLYNYQMFASLNEASSRILYCPAAPHLSRLAPHFNIL